MNAIPSRFKLSSGKPRPVFEMMMKQTEIGRSFGFECRHPYAEEYGSPSIFTRVDGRALTDIKRTWASVCEKAGLVEQVPNGEDRAIWRPTVRMHDLRHSFASILVSTGASLPLFGRMLGHTQAQTTARHAHLYDDSLREVAEMVGAVMLPKLDLNGETPQARENHVIDYHPGALPEGAIPLHEAIRRFVPDQWREFERAEEAEKQARRRQYDILHVLRNTAGAALKVARQAVERAFVEKLIARELTAFAQHNPPFGEWRRIPADACRGIQIKHVRGRDLIGHNFELTNVHVIEGDKTQLLEPMRSGAAGRPTSRHLVLDELDRLIATGELARLISSGELENTLQAAAKHMINWLKRTHPIAPPMTQTTMENAIRAKFSKFKKDLTRLGPAKPE